MRLIKNVGTRSILFGVHQFIIHPITVAIAWIKLYGWTWDIRIWTSFIVHDWGYWGKPNMDGKEGETHVELGAKIMHKLFDKHDIVKQKILDHDDLPLRRYLKHMELRGYELISYRKNVPRNVQNVYIHKNTKKDNKWYYFTLFHSRYYTKRNNAQYSKLCVADKLAFTILPKWWYIFVASLSGEIYEYINHKRHEGKNLTKSDWYDQLYTKMIKWSYEHKDLKEDKDTKL